MVDIKFHCNVEKYFKHGFLVRAFSSKEYSEEYSIEMHNHDFYEVNIVLSGTGTHCIENNGFPVRRGDVFVIPPMVAHAYYESSHLEVYHIILEKGFVEANWEEAARVKGFLQLMEIEPFLRSSSAKGLFLHLSQTQLLQLETDLAIVEDHPYDWEECCAMKYHTTWKILYWFSKLLYHQIQVMEENAEQKYEVQIIRVLEYIHTHYGSKITIEGLCRSSYMSRSTFLRSFHAVCGCAPIEYLNNYRCKKALELLEGTELARTEIAHLCGFYDLSHMERMLKKYS